jgi:signal transduction histidine kinase
MAGWMLLLGVVLSAPVWIGLTYLAGRRLWRNARRLNARARGQGRLAELGQLAGGLAHEIKNPLSTINVNLQLLAEDLDRYDDEDHRRLQRRLASVRGESDRLKATLDDFLHFAGRHEMDFAAVDLRQVVGDMTDFFASQADAAGVVLRTLPGETPLPVRVDVNLLKQALLNLLVNAVQAMPNGGELILRLSALAGRAIVEITDTGVGIQPDQKQRIFDPFFSTKGQGTGLGLPTTRRIVLEHEGTIRVDSEPGKGTCFTVALPLRGA